MWTVQALAQPADVQSACKADGLAFNFGQARIWQIVEKDTALT